jgi:hypothetical protein
MKKPNEKIYGWRSDTAITIKRLEAIKVLVLTVLQGAARIEAGDALDHNADCESPITNREVTR